MYLVSNLKEGDVLMNEFQLRWNVLKKFRILVLVLLTLFIIGTGIILFSNDYQFTVLIINNVVLIIFMIVLTLLISSRIRGEYYVVNESSITKVSRFKGTVTFSFIDFRLREYKSAIDGISDEGKIVFRVSPFMTNKQRLLDAFDEYVKNNSDLHFVTASNVIRPNTLFRNASFLSALLGVTFSILTIIMSIIEGWNYISFILLGVSILLIVIGFLLMNEFKNSIIKIEGDVLNINGREFAISELSCKYLQESIVIMKGKKRVKVLYIYMYDNWEILKGNINRN